MVPRPKSRPIMGVFDMIRLLASCVSVANRAGQIIREVAQQGMLGVVDKARWIEANLFFPFTLVIRRTYAIIRLRRTGKPRGVSCRH